MPYSTAIPCWADEIQPKGTNAYQIVTGDDSEGDRRHWDKLFNTRAYIYGKEPSPFLKDHISLLLRTPSSQPFLMRNRHAADIAMGEGRNAVFLAKMGFSVDGVDISEVALRKAKHLAHENGVTLNTVIADLNHYKLKPEFYHVIVNIDYLQRNLIPQIKRGLKKQGIVIYENYTLDQLNNVGGQYLSRDSLLNKGELKELFKDFQILVYRESNDGTNAKASIIARKP